MNPKVSIIVPIYNVSKFIERCAHSLFNQTFNDIEYIFVNDCTPDNSVDVLKEIIDIYPQRKNMVRIIEHDVNKGLAAARNTGLSIANGEYIQHIDSDDFIEKNMIESLYKKAIEDNADIVITDFIFDWGKVTKNCIQKFTSDPAEFTKLLLSAEVLPGVVNKLIKKTLYINNDIRAITGINNGEDYATTPRLSYFAKKIAKTDKPLYHYSQENENAYTKSYSKTSISNLVSALNILNDFFSKKEDYEKYKVSLIQGQLRKKIDMLNSASVKDRNYILSIFPETKSVYKHTDLSLHEKMVFYISKINVGFLLSFYLFSYKYLLKFVQILKGRK